MARRSHLAGAATIAPPMQPLRIAVVGAGPVGLALSLLAARTLPSAQVCLFDARARGADVSGDARTLEIGRAHV